jgi:hypothetical protein
MKLYVGRPESADCPHVGQVFVVDNGKQRVLPPRHDLRNHSPDGFAWGYGGSGPAQLALAMLADATGDDALAQRHYQDFKFAKIAGLPRDSWQITDTEVREWLEIKQAQHAS